MKHRKNLFAISICLRIYWDERGEIAAQLWKKDVTVGEYIEKVFPEIFEKMPECSKEAYYNQKINWPDLTQYRNFTPGMYTLDGKLIDNSSESRTLGVPVLTWANQLSALTLEMFIIGQKVGLHSRPTFRCHIWVWPRILSVWKALMRFLLIPRLTRGTIYIT